MSADTLVLAIISALVAGEAKAVEAMLLALTQIDASRAAEIFEAMQRGSRARDARETAKAVQCAHENTHMRGWTQVCDACGRGREIS